MAIMIEHAVGVVSLERFAEISHMDHDEMGALLLDTMAENNKLREFLGGNSIVTDYWKDEDGTMHVLTTDGEHTYEYMRGGLAEENAKLRELVLGLHKAYVGALNECEGMDAGLIWDNCEMVDTELAKSHARFEAGRHRFDVAMSELGIEVDG